MAGVGGGAVMLVLCAAGVYMAYLYQGYLQEVIVTATYEPSAARMPHLGMLHGLQSFVCFVAAWLVNAALSLARGGRDAKAKVRAPLFEYMKPAITNTIGPALGILALKNIPYSSQVVVKSCKMVPVMVMGTIFGKKRYTRAECACVAVICAGLVIFTLNKSASASKKLAEPNLLWGYSLCLCNLALDGFTNAYQDKMNAKYAGTSPLDMMCWMNFWIAAFVSVHMFAVTGAGFDLASFFVAHPRALFDVLAFCLCGAAGQLFIFLTIHRFGSLTLTLVTTTRKFFSILISSALMGSTLVPKQWLGVALLFAGLLWNIRLKAVAKAAKPKSA